MILKKYASQSETQKKRSLLQRMVFVHGFLLVCGLLIVARLMELQVIDRNEYYAAAQSQHFGRITLPAQRGEIYAKNSKTGETTILATNTTSDLIYVDPVNIEPTKYPDDDPAAIAEYLADMLITEEYHSLCTKGSSECPRELVTFIGSPYATAFDPLLLVRGLGTGTLLEPIPQDLPVPRPEDISIPDITEVRRLFARDIERRIAEKRVTFVPVKYSATKDEMSAVVALNAPGITVNEDQKLIFGNPEEIPQNKLPALSRQLASILGIDSSKLAYSLRSRPLRYVPVMRRLPPALSLAIKEGKLASIKDANAKRKAAYESDDPLVRKNAERLQDPFRAIALIPEHWRFYPDGTIASQVVGFMNTNQEAQYGIERTFDAQLRGQEGEISTVSDLQGGQILTTDQTIVDPKDGDTIVLTIDPFIQKEVERILDAGIKTYEADSAQAIVMDPFTGRIVAMANAPVFQRNSYADVYEKIPVYLSTIQEQQMVAEIYHPVTNARILKDYRPAVFSPEGRATFSERIQEQLNEVEKMYDLRDLARYYVYEGENARYEVFPTQVPHIWLKYKNNIGVGAYLNRTIQEIYEPGSVMKPITMGIAIDQGEVLPDDIYDDTGPVEVDEYVIKNALLVYYGKVTMTNCLELSINTCMTSVSFKMGRKLFHRMIEQFGFGKVTNIELEDELAGSVKPWRSWSRSDLATASFGQGISATPLQVITAFAALANGGRLMKPTIVDSVVHPDGTVEKTEPRIIDQVITEETSKTITAMLESSANNGFAKTGKVPKYRLSAKTGTSQIAAGARGYESGTGSTINTYMGYAPPENPRFIVLVKYDRAKFRIKVFSEATAGPTFKEIATFLYDYYGLPPDEK